MERNRIASQSGGFSLGSGVLAAPASALERLTPVGARARALLPERLGAWPGRIALGVIVAAILAVLAFSTAGSTVLVPRSGAAFPGWEAGPLGSLFGHLSLKYGTGSLGFTGLLLVVTVAYAVALLSARSLSLRTIAVTAVAINLLLLLGPPLQLNDVFNYLGYARLGALHGLNPYTHTMTAESYDPVYSFSSWHNLASPYGPLFTALSYPLAWLSLSVAYWILKVATIAASLGFLWCVHRCAQLLGRDSRPALMLVVANPIYIFYAVGGFHNDFFMLLPSMAAITLLLARRDRSAGAVLMLAVAIKMTAIVLLPFLLIAARPPERRLRLITGAVAAAVPLVALWLGLFGPAIPNISQQDTLITGFSIPNLLGLLAGQGGATTDVVRVLNAVLVLVVLLGLRRRDWLGAAGWAMLALIASVGWLMPWYIVWALPLAAIAESRRLRRVVLIGTVFLVLSFLPETGKVVSSLGLRPMGSPADQATLSLQQRLQQ